MILELLVMCSLAICTYVYKYIFIYNIVKGNIIIIIIVIFISVQFSILHEHYKKYPSQFKWQSVVRVLRLQCTSRYILYIIRPDEVFNFKRVLKILYDYMQSDKI